VEHLCKPKILPENGRVFLSVQGMNLRIVFNINKITTEQYDIVEVPFIFQKGKLMLRLAFFNKDGSIGGMYILPIQNAD